MSFPVDTLNAEQKSWYAKLVVTTILADKQITQPEALFLKEVIRILPTDEERVQLFSRIKGLNPPPLTPPPGIPPHLLAGIFMELILIVISDQDADRQEIDFLKEVAKLFQFAESYQRKLFNWLDQGLRWKLGENRLVPGHQGSMQVPVADMTEGARKWYATVLLATILLDREVDQFEVALLKTAFGCLQDKKNQQQLAAYLKNRFAPPVEAAPAGVSQEHRLLMFIEIMQVISADEVLSYQEQAHLQQIAKKCEIDEETYDRLLAWTEEGVTWRREKTKLIAQVSMGESKMSAVPERVVSKDNNSLVERKVVCAVCDSNAQAVHWQLKPKSQKPSHNIFGIQTFVETADGFDQVDYNQVKVIVCPFCYFASQDKEDFTSPSPLIKNDYFKKLWLDGLNERKIRLGGMIQQLQTVQRTPDAVLESYKTAIDAQETLFKSNGKAQFTWGAVAAKLTLAEVLSGNGAKDRCNKLLHECMVTATEVFTKAEEKALNFKAARLLLILGLYFNDQQTINSYYNFFLEQGKKQDSLAPEDSKLLVKISGEVKGIMANKADYRETSLEGLSQKAQASMLKETLAKHQGNEE